MSLEPYGLYARIKDALGAVNPSEIARKLQLKPQSVYLWQKGNFPSLETLETIASVSNTSIHWLATGRGSKSPGAGGGLEPGQIPIYFEPHEQGKIRELAAKAGRTLEEEIREIVIEEMMKRGLLGSEEPSNLLFFGEPVKSVELPLMGWIAAGEPLHLVTQEQTVRVPDFMMKSGKQYFVLHVRGDSMVDDHIPDGSLIICEARTTAQDGERVIAVIDRENVTVKRIYREGTRIRLQPSNPLHKPIFVEAHQELSIQGVVAAVFHK